MILALLLALFLFAVPAQAQVFFDEDYENHLWIGGNGNPWDTNACGTPAQDGCNGVISTVAPPSGAAHSGTHVLRENFGGATAAQISSGSSNPTCGLSQLDPPGCTQTLTPGFPLCAPGCGAYYDRVHTGVNELWWRLWLQISSNWISEQQGSKIGYEFGTTGSEPLWLMGGTNPGVPNNGIWMQVVTTNFYTCPGGQFDRTCNYTPNVTNVPITASTWHCIEIHVKSDSPYGAGNGQIEVYVNGTQTLNYTNRHINDGPIPYGLSRTFTQYGFGTRWLDQVAVGAARIGCGSSPPPLSVPNAPTNFQLTLLDWMQRIWARLVTGMVA